MTILITGATGLVGARLMPRLIEEGLDCRALVRAGKKVTAGATAVEGDLLDPATLEAAVRGTSAIIHLAAVFRSPDPDMIWKSNLEGTRNLIAAVQSHAPTARFIMASTSHVYGPRGSHPGREDDATDPGHAYAASKIAAEEALRESGLTWSIQRFGFVYGDKDGHLEALPDLAAHAKLHPALRMSTIHHRDIATAMTLALSGAMDTRTVNLTDDAPTSLYELAQLVGKPIAPSSEPLSHPWHFHIDGTLARSLGFRPSVSTVYQAAEQGLL